MVFTSFALGMHLALQTAAFQLSIPNLPKAPTAETVLAKVNGVPIKAKDIEDLLWDVHAEEILNEISYYQVAKAEADRMGLVVTNQEIEQGVQREIDQMKANLPPNQTIEGAMAQAGQTKGRLYLAVKTSLYLTKIAFQDFEPKAFVRVSTIVVRPRSVAAADITATIAVVQKAYDRLKSGEPWEKLVDELVVDANGKQARGLLGWRQLAAFPQAVQDEMVTLKKGGITKPVQTDNGIQIFRIEAKGDGASKEELEQMRTELSEVLRMQAVQKLRKNLKIERLYPAKKEGS
jgi:foldase protein PrsA